MPEPGALRRSLRLLAALLLGVASLLVGVPAHAADRRADRTEDKVALSVLDLSPLTPAITSKPAPLTIRVQLTNLTQTTLTKVLLTGQRDAPLVSGDALDSFLTGPQTPTSLAQEFSTGKPVQVDVPAGGSVEVEVATTTATTPGDGICLCTPAGVYPLFVEATQDGELIGRTQTVLPSFYAPPPTAQVTWLWPIIDRPHRLLSDTTFTDDDLAGSVQGGRLDDVLRTLEVATTVQPDLALTVVVDPELLDELAVMATGSYRVARDGTTARRGTGGDAAKGWLARFTALLDQAPKLELAFVPYADPDFASLTRARLGWSETLPPPMQARLALLLGTRVPTTTIAWPAAGRITPRTAVGLAAAGPRVAVLDGGAVPRSSLPTDGSAVRVTTRSGDLTVVTTAADVGSAVAAATSKNGGGAAALPQLGSQLAIRLAEDVQDDRHAAHRFVLAPQRQVDPDPIVAARAITATTSVFWAAPTNLATARATTGSTMAGRDLVAKGAETSLLPGGLVSSATEVAVQLPVLQSLLGGGTGPSNALLAGFATALQRIESTAWTAQPTTGSGYAETISGAVSSIEAGVSIVTRSSSTYTLASKNSPLPVTIENDLDYPVFVQVRVETMTGLGDFSAAPPTTEQIGANSKKTVKVAATVIRSGRIQVQATLQTPSGLRIGAPVVVYVHSTALGRIGLIITISAAVLLVFAFVRRFWLRYRRGPAVTEPAA